MAATIPNFDATFCGRLPLHQTNLIQPHGVLLVIDQSSFDVLQVSENINSIQGLDAQVIAGKNASVLFEPTSFTELQQMVQQGMQEKHTMNLVVLSEGGPVTCSASLHQKDASLFVELLLPNFAPATGRSFLHVFQEIKAITTAISLQQQVQDFAITIAREMKRLTGFDKVMVYSFDDEWHGTVLAEEKVAEMDAYLGLRFPASDIPKPARDLYLKNPLRFIPNCFYQPARLYPLLHPIKNAFSDLSSCDLRSVAGVHLEYMKNMHTTASLSMRLVHNGQLWGLISCHNRDERYFSFEELGLFELLSGMFSAQLSLILNKASGQKQHHLQEQLASLIPRLHAGSQLQQAIRENAAGLQQLLAADGIAFNFNGTIEKFGAVPDDNDLERLFYWLEVQDSDTVVHRPSLSKVFEEAEAFAQVGSGILALPVVPKNGTFLVAFRPEAVEEVAWGGNPHEALQIENDGKTYHPRNSFNIWKQTVRQAARPWDKAELVIAEALKNVLGNIILRRLHA